MRAAPRSDDDAVSDELVFVLLPFITAAALGFGFFVVFRERAATRRSWRGRRLVEPDLAAPPRDPAPRRARGGRTPGLARRVRGVPRPRDLRVAGPVRGHVPVPAVRVDLATAADAPRRPAHERSRARGRQRLVHRAVAAGGQPRAGDGPRTRRRPRPLPSRGARSSGRSLRRSRSRRRGTPRRRPGAPRPAQYSSFSPASNSAGRRSSRRSAAIGERRKRQVLRRRGMPTSASASTRRSSIASRSATLAPNDQPTSRVGRSAGNAVAHARRRRRAASFSSSRPPP